MDQTLADTLTGWRRHLHTHPELTLHETQTAAKLADRLRKLEAAGVVERRPYSEHPPRHEYHFTEAGRELFPVTLALSQWGDRWAVDTPALTRRHSCGQPVQVDLVCHHCGQPVTRDTIHAEPADA